MSRPHAVVLPFPAQGHVIPFLELSYCLVDRGFHVTFVNNEITHQQITTTLLAEKVYAAHDCIKMVAISDGMALKDRHNISMQCDSMLATMQGNFEELLTKLNESEADKVTCMIADGTMAWAVDVAKKVGITQVAILWTVAAEIPALGESIPALIEAQIIDDNGFVAAHDQMINLSATMPPMDTNNLFWMCLPEEMRQTIFHYFLACFKATKNANYILCNTFSELEPAAFELVPHVLPIGPLLPGRRSGQPVGHFWPEDSSCLDWLDEQADQSVIYVAFGSFTLLDQRQFHELALGLELSGKPFMWVVRPDLMDGSNGAYPEGFEERVVGRGKMVSWAPQQKVLAHPSIACFMSHCGWNSTMEGIIHGVPFLCWPYFADQFFNATYICDVWKTGLRLDLGEDGVISRVEVTTKVGSVANDEDIRARVAKLKEIARWNVNGGTSAMNFDQVIKKIVQQ